jgi:ADP-ribose pyrophosphatase
MVGRAFPIDEVLAMIVEGTIKDAATVATLGLLSLKGLL